jgi:hypothetical protein
MGQFANGNNCEVKASNITYIPEKISNQYTGE